jgi:hypothetical protein
MHPSTVKRRTTGLQRDTAGKLNRVQALEAVFIGTVDTKDGRITTPLEKLTHRPNHAIWQSDGA